MSNNNSYVFKSPNDITIIIKSIMADYPYLNMGEMAIFELMTNAIEHGNLEIGFDEKTELLERDTVDTELENRLQDDRFKDRSSSITITELPDEIKITILDEGRGFDWKKYVSINLEDAVNMHGRGIPMSVALCKSLHYSDKGNEVTVIFDRLV